MQIDGKPILTRTTISAGRTLCAVALILILTDLYDVDLSGLEALGVKIGQDEFAKPAFWLLLFTSVGYFVNWFGDVYSFRGWNKPADRTGFGAFGAGGAPLQTEIETALSKHSSLVSNAESFRKLAVEEKVDQKAIDDLAFTVKEVSEVLASVKLNAWRISNLGRATLYVWHGIVPLTLSIWALFLIWN